ncbi:MAG: putative zinc-binding metallopeptidase [Planctomycetota bacterium]
MTVPALADGRLAFCPGNRDKICMKEMSTVVRSGPDDASACGPLSSALGDEQLLALRLCDLNVTIEGSWLTHPIDQVLHELAEHRIRCRPHFWLSDEWFTPDNVPGIAVPFYLAHARLMELERKQMLEVEGGTMESCLRILRHEIGHAIDNAYQFHRRRDWVRIFGRNSQRYPDYYRPKPHSKRHVLHLDSWYAQAHPAEDFAETFAVWLTPNSMWEKRYAGWPALKKLQYVDQCMNEIAGHKPAIRSRRLVDPLIKLTRTLHEHYQAKRARYGRRYPDFFDRDLRRLFADTPRNSPPLPAARFLRKSRAELRRTVARWTGEYQYTIDQVLREMIARCDELRLWVDRPVEESLRETFVLLTVQTMNYLHSGRHRVAL